MSVFAFVSGRGLVDYAVLVGNLDVLMDKPSSIQKTLNWLGIVGGVASIIGLPLSFVFFIQSRESREPRFLTEPAFEIVNSSELDEPPFKVLNRNGDEIQNPVNIQRFYFWNAGKKAIKSGDILREIKVELSLNELIGEKILDAQCTSISRKDITKFYLTKIDRSTLSIGFDILEKSDGATCQLILEGSGSMSITGAIEEVGTLTNQSLLPRDQNYLGVLAIRIAMTIFIGSVPIVILSDIRRKLQDNLKVHTVEYVVVVPFLFLFAYFVYFVARTIIYPDNAQWYLDDYQPSYQVPIEITEGE